MSNKVFIAKVLSFFEQTSYGIKKNLFTSKQKTMWCATQWNIQHLCSSEILLCHWVLVAQHSVASSSGVRCLMKNNKTGGSMKCNGWVWLDTHPHILHGSIRPLKMGPLHSLKMMGTQHSVIEHNMPEEWRAHLLRLEGMKT